MKTLSDCCGAPVIYGKRKRWCKNCKKACVPVEDHKDDEEENLMRGYKKGK